MSTKEAQSWETGLFSSFHLVILNNTLAYPQNSATHMQENDRD